MKFRNVIAALMLAMAALIAAFLWAAGAFEVRLPMPQEPPPQEQAPSP